jgi:hypothetical protein
MLVRWLVQRRRYILWVGSVYAGVTGVGQEGFIMHEKITIVSKSEKMFPFSDSSRNVLFSIDHKYLATLPDVIERMQKEIDELREELKLRRLFARLAPP